MLIGGHVVGFFLVNCEGTCVKSNLGNFTGLAISQGGTCQATSGVSLESILLVLSFQLMNPHTS